MQTLPTYVSLVFGLVVLVTVVLFHRVLAQSVGMQRARIITGGILLWTVAQSVIALSGFYRNNWKVIPPRITLAVAPTLLVIICLFILPRGRRFVDRIPTAPLTYLHTVRVPVEIVLYWLYLHQTIPELMTFAGRNFDILAGITAPFVAYFGLQQDRFNRRFLMGWNVVALTLLLFIVINAILSAPTPLQQLAFDQPNVAIFYFPFVLLPAVVVPIVLFSHLVCLRQLANNH